MLFMPQSMQLSYEQALAMLGEGQAVQDKVVQDKVVKDRDESKREAAVDLQAILRKEGENDKNIDRTPPKIFKISEEAAAQLKIQGPALKSLDLYVLVPYDPDYYPDDMVELIWDRDLLSRGIFPHLKAVETLKLADGQDSFYSELRELPSLCHLQLDSELSDRGCKAPKAVVTYSVDTTNKELNQYLYQLLCKLFEREPVSAGPNLKSLKITYSKTLVGRCLPALEALQKKEGGFVIKSGQNSLDISINSPNVSMDALVLK